MIYRTFLFLSIVFILVLIASCGNNNHSNSNHKQATVTDDHSHQENNLTHMTEISNMKLDNGKKWKMDEHTRSTFKKMVSSFTSSDQATITGLQKSGIQLKGQVKDLIKGCTMDGDAHNQLHIFLTGYIPAVDSLASSSNLESAKKQAIKIKEYLNKYENYFE